MQNKYTLLTQANESVLVKNGNFVLCPFLPPFNMIISDSKINGGQSIKMSSCGTFCPHASLVENKYTITCGCKEVSFEIEQEKTESKVISLSPSL